MKKYVSLLVFMLLFLVVVSCESVNLVCVQASTTIIIRSDGRVEGTSKIQRDGDVYTFTDDISGTIKVERDGVTIDGAGYTLREGNIDLREREEGYLSPCYGNVVVKNVKFNKGYIFASSKDNCFINNIFEKGGIHVVTGGGKDSVIKYNVFIDGKPAVFVDYTGFNTVTVVTENDFINCEIFLGTMMVYRFDNNYWSDYQKLYPKAKEIEHTGVWDTPYTYNKTGSFSGNSFVDNNPLVKPVDGAGISETNKESLMPVPTTSADGDLMPVPTTSIEDRENHINVWRDHLIFSNRHVVVVGVVSMVIVCISLLVYFNGVALKKQKT